MSLLIDTTYRTDATEIMDDFSIKGEILYDSLDKLATINKFLGGNAVTISGLKTLLKGQPKTTPIKIIDLGCGGGDMLRDVSKFGKKEGYIFKLIGVDANEDTIKHAAKLSQQYTEISFTHCNIFSKEFEILDYDVVLSTLFLHHFKDTQILDFLPLILKKAHLGIVINDLHRHPMAYYLFKMLCITIKNKMIIEDGLTSVLRGFKRQELEKISQQLQVNYQIKWKWAFRYQWIIQKKI